MTYREFIRNATAIDIGDYTPWHKSPVVQKICADPTSVICANKRRAYEKTAGGLKFRLEAFSGGGDSLNYQYEGVPKIKRPFAKVLQRASSSESSTSAVFEIDAVPAQGATLELEGLDDEKPGRASFKALVNGKPIFDGVDSFDDKDWSWMKIPVPAEALQKGSNTIEILNTTPEGISAVADIYAAKDYHWGWLLISDAKLLLASGHLRR